MNYDFETFLNSVKYLDKADILETAYKKHKALDKHSTLYTIEARRNLQKGIGHLLFWLEKGQKPADITDLEFMLFRPVCESLIRKNQLPKEALELFENE